MSLTTPIPVLKRKARLLARAQNLALHQALDHMAQTEGYSSWSALAALHHSTPQMALQRAMTPGALVLLAARAFQGKTRVALQLLRAHSGPAYMFSLDATAEDLAHALKDQPRQDQPRQDQAHQDQAHQDLDGLGHIQIDLDDEISAAYICAKLLRNGDPAALVAVDYLQLLDQKRSKPALQDQLQQLRHFAQEHGTRFLFLSQIDRRFETAARALPALEDLRLPNPVDLALFDQICVLHQGRHRMITPR